MKKIITTLALLFTLGVSYAAVNLTNFHSDASGLISPGDYGLRFTANNSVNVTGVTVSSGTHPTTARIWDNSFNVIGTASFSGDTATFTGVPITAGNTYFVTINSGSSDFVTEGGSVAAYLPSNNTDISFPASGNAIYHMPYGTAVTGWTSGASFLGITSIITNGTSSGGSSGTTTNSTTTPPASSSPNIVFVGDSLTAGTTADVTSQYPTLVSASGYTKTNLGIPGKYVSAMYADSDSNLNPLLGTDKTDDIVVIWGGTNDLYNQTGGDPVATFNILKAFAQHERALGAKVVVLTMISRIDNQYVTGQTLRHQYNDLIRAHWSEFADSLADVASDPNIGDDNDSLNTTYFSDGAHLTQLGYGIVANYVQNSLHSINSTIPAGTAPVATTPSITPAGSFYAHSGSESSLLINAPTGTFSDGQRIVLRIKSTVAQSLTWDPAYQDTTLAKPSAITANTYNYFTFSYNVETGKFDLVGKI